MKSPTNTLMSDDLLFFNPQEFEINETVKYYNPLGRWLLIIWVEFVLFAGLYLTFIK